MAPFDTSLNQTEAMELMLCPIQEESFPTALMKRRKRVRILAEPQIFALIVPLSEMSKEQRLQGWWQKDEYESSKMAAKNKCRELRKMGMYKGTLTDAYDQAKAAPLDLHTFDVIMSDESVSFLNAFWLSFCFFAIVYTNCISSLIFNAATCQLV